MLNTSQQATEALEAIAEAFSSLPRRQVAGTVDPPRASHAHRRWVIGGYAADGHDLPDQLVAASFALSELVRSLPPSARLSNPDTLRELAEQIVAATGVPRPVLAWMLRPGESEPDPADGVIATIVAALRSGEGAQAIPVAERQLTQLRFDLHDGPLQDVLLLAEDLRMFQSQVESVGARRPSAACAPGRPARRSQGDAGGSRRRSAIGSQRCSSRRSSAVNPSPTRLLQLSPGVCVAYRGKTPELHLEGDFDGLTDAHQITLPLGLVREALSNIREHSDASRVSITIRSDAHGVAATVVDDGRGFDPESALIKAAREGHLGLVGMQ